MNRELNSSDAGFHQPSHVWAAALAAVTLFGAALRAIHLDGGLWYDEYVTLVEYVRLPLSDLLTTYSGNNNHPLYSLLAHVSVSLFGEHAWSLRLPAALFGVLTIPALYALGRFVSTRREALSVSILLALSYHHIWFSQNARGYTALLFFTVVSSRLFLRGLRDGGGLATWGGYGAATALGLYTHLTMAFVVASHFFLWGCRAARRLGGTKGSAGPFLGFAVAAVLTAALYAPIAPQVLHFFLDKKPAAAVRAAATPAWALAEALRVLQSGLGIGPVGVALLACLCLAGLVSYWRRDREVAILAGLPVVLGAAAVLLLHQPMRPRFFFASAGFALLLVVRGAFSFESWFVRRTGGPLLRGAGRHAGAALVLLASALSAASLPQLYRLPKQDYEGARDYVEANRRPNEPVLTSGMAAFPYLRYFHEPWEEVRSPEEVERILKPGLRAWFVYTFPPYIEASAPGLMGVVRRSFERVAVFPGTLGGGEVYVARTRAATRGTSDGR